MEAWSAQATVDPYAEVEESRKFLIYAPVLQEYRSSFAMDIMQLPLGNLNQLTEAYISSIENSCPKSCYCGIFSLDPFTQWDDFISRIRAAGFRGVCNFPTLPEFGLEEKDSLDASGFSFQHELKVLARIAKDGMKIAVICPSAEELCLARSALQDTAVAYCLAENVTMN